MTTQSARADAFHALHHGQRTLRLANAWDAASAAVIATTGAPAIATTSAGVAWSLGVADGQLLGRDRAAALVARVTAVVDVPVTADIEAGFAEDDDGLRETVDAVLRAGAVGVNIEDVAPDAADRLRDIGDQARRISVVRSQADASGIDLFVNARIDTYLRGVGDESGRFDETLARAAAFIAAGASGIFVPGVGDADTIARLVEGISAPVNVLVGPGTPAVPELERLGVARVSLGSKVAAAAYALAERAARELADTGTYSSVADELPYDRLNALVS